MAHSTTSELVAALAEEFIDRHRRGENPQIGEYLANYPELASEIHEVFPAVALLEQIALSDEPDVPQTNAELPVRQVGDFRIIREVGRGGMGVVYEAEQLSLGRFVALKLLPAQLTATGHGRERFLREAKTAAKLHHTNIVPVFGYGQVENEPYYAMQFIRGQSLDAVIQELRSRAVGLRATSGDTTQTQAASLAQSLVSGEFLPTEKEELPILTPDQESEIVSTVASGSWLSEQTAVDSGRNTLACGIARIGVQVAEALSYAHQQGVLHRDIKPSNLLLDRSGTVWVTDFGLAKTEGLPDLTRVGDLLGTMRYMPPEAFEGTADARSDVYSLGLTLYELLTLRPAFAESDRRKLLKLVNENDPPSLRKAVPGIPRDLATVVEKAIQKDPTQRYQTAAALGEDLRRFLEDRPIMARPTSFLEQSWRACKRNPAFSSMAAATLLALVVGLFGALWGQAVARSREADAQEQKKRANDAALALRQERDEITRLKDQLADRLYIADMNRAKLNWDWGNPALVRELIAIHAPQPNEPDRRGLEWFFLNRLANHLSTTISCDIGWIKHLQFNPTGELIVAGGDGEAVKLFSRSGKLLRIFEPNSGKLSQPLFTADGQELIIPESSSEKTVLRFWNLRTQHWSRQIPVHASVRQLATDDAGRVLIAGTQSGAVHAWDTKTWKELPTWLGHSSFITGLELTPDGTRAVSCTFFDTSVRLWNPATGQTLRVAKEDVGFRPRAVLHLAVRPDGQQAAATDSALWTWDMTQSPPRIAWQVRLAVNGVRYTPDGKHLVAACWDSQVRVFEAETGTEVTSFRGHTNVVETVAIAPDGKTIASAGRDRTIRLWNLQKSSDSRIALQDGEPMQSALVETSGKHLIAAYSNSSKQGSLRVVDLSTGIPKAVFGAHQRGVNQLRLSPDGQTLATVGRDGFARLWDVAKLCVSLQPKPLREYQLHTTNNGVCDLQFRPDGQEIATCGWDATVKLTNLKTGEVVRTIATPGRLTWSTAYSPDGSKLAVQSEIHGVDKGSSVLLYDPNTGAELYRLAENAAEGIAPWRTYSLPLFAPDGKSLFVVTDDQEVAIRIYDVATGLARSQVFRGHTGRIKSLAITKNGRRLLSASMDGTVRLWDVASGLELLTLRGHGSVVNTATFTPKEDAIITASLDHSVRIWETRQSQD
jgi:eukaryotic-like serine/threonine-protein kinase